MQISLRMPKHKFVGLRRVFLQMEKAFKGGKKKTKTKASAELIKRRDLSALPALWPLRERREN